MLNLSSAELHALAVQLEQAMRSNREWAESVQRKVVCRLAAEPQDLRDDSHRRCAFGDWYHSYHNPRMREHRAFAALEEPHTLMHGAARRLLRTVDSGAAIQETDYDRYQEALKRFQLQIDTLHREVLHALANLDPLTGVYITAGMLTKLRQQHELVRGKLRDCSISIMDLDSVAGINQRFGHQAGDQVLAAAAQFVVKNTRPCDLVFRYGGEEFLICLENAELERAGEIIERIRGGLEHASVVTEQGERLHATASFGLTALDPDVLVEESISRADQAMYAAKRSGRNRLEVWRH